MMKRKIAIDNNINNKMINRAGDVHIYTLL